MSTPTPEASVPSSSSAQPSDAPITAASAAAARTVADAAADKAAGGPPLLRLTELTKHFPQFRQTLVKRPDNPVRAVDGVSFSVRRNAITTVIGPNGAGKSTLFNLISGQIRPHAGQVAVNGIDRTGAPPHLMQRAGLGRSFQITNLFLDLTVFENLQLAAQRLESPR